jgi:uncharacterized protein (DUF4415 family)
MSRKRLIPPTEEENKRINAGIAADTDTFEPSDKEFEQAKPAEDVLPPDLYDALIKRRRGQRGPQNAPLKVHITLRVDPDILAHYKATGQGWQGRMNNALRRAIKAR